MKTEEGVVAIMGYLFFWTTTLKPNRDTTKIKYLEKLALQMKKHK